MMLNHPALEHENGVFCDIGGEVGDALEVFGDPEDIDAAADDGRMFRHKGDEFPQNLIAQVVDDAVAAADLKGKLRVFVDKRLNHIGKHAPRQFIHARNIDEGFNRRNPYKL